MRALSMVVIGSVLAWGALAGEAPPVIAVAQTDARETAEVTLRVGGITCASCAYIVKRTLTRTAGVWSLELVETDDPTVLLAVVIYERALVSAEALAAATTDAGYPTEVVAGPAS